MGSHGVLSSDVLGGLPAFCGGRDLISFVQTCASVQRCLCDAQLDLQTAFAADRRLRASELAMLAGTRYRLSRMRVHSDAVTLSGGAEVVALVACKWLRSLDLSHCSGLKNVDALGVCGHLEHLNVSFCKNVAQLQGLVRCIQLVSLNASHCDSLEDLSPLRSCTSMKVLDISHCARVKAATFPEMQLTTLIWAGGHLKNCQAPARCPHLLVLNLTRSYDLTTIAELSACSSLIDLDLFSCGKLSSLEGLQSLTKLETLNLNTCMQLVDISAMSSLRKLKNVNLNRCTRIADLSPLVRVGSSLASVSLHGCKIACDMDVQQLLGHQCAVSASTDKALKGSMTLACETAVMDMLAMRSIQSASIAGLKQGATSSEIDLKLRAMCGSMSLTVGIFWEDSCGALTLVGAHVQEDYLEKGWAFIAGSRVCKFRPSVGVPGRALSNGYDWIEDVQELDATAYPRQRAATASGLHTAFAVAVPGGVAEFMTFEILQKSGNMVNMVSQCFGSVVETWH